MISVLSNYVDFKLFIYLPILLGFKPHNRPNIK